MLIYPAVFILQLLYIIIKFMGIRHVIGNNVYSRMIISANASVVWLVSTAIGVNQIIQHDYIILVPYVLGNLSGVLLEDKIREYV